MSRYTVPSSEEASKILSTVAVSKGFHFYIDYQEPTWVVAISLEDFLANLETIDLRSVEFHFNHQDFRNWVNDVFDDYALFRGICSIDKEVHGEDLRTQLIKIFKGRIKELKEIVAKSKK
jgi:hypothetical protein